MRYDFSKMNADSFELMIRSLNEKIFGVKCEQYGLGPDGQREFAYNGTLKDSAGNIFEGRTIGQVKYKYVSTKEEDYTWLAKTIKGELDRFRNKDAEYIPDNYLFFTNIVLTPVEKTGVKDKINAFLKSNNDIIKNFYVLGYDEICAMVDNNRDVATSYASLILPGDVLMKALSENEVDYTKILEKYLFCEFEEDMYTRLEQAGSVTEKKISIERVCVDLNVKWRNYGTSNKKFANHVFKLGNETLGYKKEDHENELDSDENFVLIGGPGKGKSTICQFIAQIYRAYYLKHLNYKDKTIDGFIEEIEKSYKYKIGCFRIPFKVALREYAAWINRKKKEDNISVLQYIKERIEKMEGTDLSTDTLRKILSEQAWIFFFDGLDEVPESSNRQEVLKQIRIFITMELKEAHCDCMIVGTTREQGYNNDFDSTRYMHLEVAELSKDDCVFYINKLFEIMEEQTEQREKYVSIMKEALEDETTSRLMKTPLQATIISILVKSGGKPPHERYSLFRQFYETMVRREKQKGIVATLNDNTDWLEEIHYMIGNRLQCESEKEENPSAEISKEELQDVIRKYVEDNRDDFYESRDKAKDKEEEFIMTITHRVCFLCENRDGFYSFSIRSMQEYFAGTYLIKDKSDEEAMKNIKGIAYSSYWRNALLFSFGYIELERKNLEPEIGLLCEQMNGKENIMKEEYTSDNLCLFGSWLAVDILAEDIFRGRQQNKYISLAAKAIELSECLDFNRFNLLTGVPEEKLVCYIKDNYYDNQENMRNAVKLYLKLQENKKNNLTNEIVDVVKKLSEEERIAIDVEILSLGFRDKMSKLAKKEILDALEQGKIKYFLPDEILDDLFDVNKPSMALKRNLFLQCIFNNITGEFDFRLDKLGINNVREMHIYLTAGISRDYQNNLEISMTDSFMIVLEDFVKDQNALRKIQSELQKMELDYLAKFCEFLLNPTLAGYQELLRELEEEKEYLRDKYLKVLHHYVPYTNVSSQEEFQQLERARELDFENFQRRDFERVCYKKTDVQFFSMVTVKDYTFDELIDTGSVPIENLVKLNHGFFRDYLWAAKVQMECTSDIADISGETADRYIAIICESVRRNFYIPPMHMVFAVLIASKFRTKLWERLPDYLPIDQMIEKQCGQIGISKTTSFQCIHTAELENIVGSIVRKALYDAKESNYLSMIPLIICDRVDLKRCITANDIKELGQLEYRIETNSLSVKLLRMCIDENAVPCDVINNILHCDIPRKVLFSELQNMLHYCKMENKERLQVEMYLRLENENFDGIQRIRQSVINDMIETKCNECRVVESMDS